MEVDNERTTSQRTLIKLASWEEFVERAATFEAPGRKE
jgi:hypothetical protein